MILSSIAAFSMTHRRTVLLVVALVWVLAAVNVAYAQDGATGEWQVSQFWDTIDRIANNEDDAAELDALREVEAVAFPSGETWPIDGAALADALGDPEKDQDALIEALHALRDEPSAAAQPDATASLEQVLARPEFQVPEESTFFQDLWRRFLSWFFQTFDLGFLDAAETPAQIWGYVVAAIAAIALGWFLWYWQRSVRRQFSAETTLPFESSSDFALSSNDALSRARDNASRGDLREAVRYLYMTTLLSLSERDLLRLDHSKTNREYLRQASGTSFAGTLGSIVDVFDRVWYGFQTIDSDSYQRYEAQVEELLK